MIKYVKTKKRVSWESIEAHRPASNGNGHRKLTQAPSFDQQYKVGRSMLDWLSSLLNSNESSIRKVAYLAEFEMELDEPEQACQLIWREVSLAAEEVAYVYLMSAEFILDELTNSFFDEEVGPLREKATKARESYERGLFVEAAKAAVAVNGSLVDVRLRPGIQHLVKGQEEDNRPRPGWSREPRPPHQLRPEPLLSSELDDVWPGKESRRCRKNGKRAFRRKRR